jgi:hypothetical protein
MPLIVTKVGMRSGETSPIISVTSLKETWLDSIPCTAGTEKRMPPEITGKGTSEPYLSRTEELGTDDTLAAYKSMIDAAKITETSLIILTPLNFFIAYYTKFATKFNYKLQLYNYSNSVIMHSICR